MSFLAVFSCIAVILLSFPTYHSIKAVQDSHINFLGRLRSSSVFSYLHQKPLRSFGEESRTGAIEFQVILRLRQTTEHTNDALEDQSCTWPGHTVYADAER